jgi:hypothetical protein
MMTDQIRVMIIVSIDGDNRIHLTTISVGRVRTLMCIIPRKRIPTRHGEEQAKKY